MIRKALEQLLADCKKRSETYQQAAMQARRESTLQADKRYLFEANRYEGIATVSRWMAEDLEKILNKKRK